MELISQMANQERRQQQEALTTRAEELEVQVGSIIPHGGMSDCVYLLCISWGQCKISDDDK